MLQATITRSLLTRQVHPEGHRQGQLEHSLRSSGQATEDSRHQQLEAANYQGALPPQPSVARPSPRRPATDRPRRPRPTGTPGRYSPLHPKTQEREGQRPLLRLPRHLHPHRQVHHLLGPQSTATPLPPNLQQRFGRERRPVLHQHLPLLLTQRRKGPRETPPHRRPDRPAADHYQPCREVPAQQVRSPITPIQLCHRGRRGHGLDRPVRPT